MEDNWNNEGGANPPEDEEPHETNGDREPRNPKKPNEEGGIALPIPKKKEIICCGA